jgi:ferredoxin
MSGSDLPHVKVGRDAARDENMDTEEEICTVEYLNYGVLDAHGWRLDDEDLFEKAAEADLDERDYGTMEVGEYRYILDAAEDHGHNWPFECRAASCANCAAVLKGGEIDMDMNLYLTDEEIEDKNYRLTCVGTPGSEHLKVVFNALRTDYLQEVVSKRTV